MPDLELTSDFSVPNDVSNFTKSTISESTLIQPQAVLLGEPACLDLPLYCSQINKKYDLYSTEGRLIGSVLNVKGCLVIDIFDSGSVVTVRGVPTKIQNFSIKSEGDLILETALEETQLLNIECRNLHIKEKLLGHKNIFIDVKETLTNEAAVEGVVVDLSAKTIKNIKSISADALLVHSKEVLENAGELSAASSLKIKAPQILDTGHIHSNKKIRLDCNKLKVTAQGEISADQRFKFIGQKLNIAGQLNLHGRGFFSTDKLTVSGHLKLPEQNFLHTANLKIKNQGEMACFANDAALENATYDVNPPVIVVDNETSVAPRAALSLCDTTFSTNRLTVLGQLDIAYATVNANNASLAGQAYVVGSTVQIKENLFHEKTAYSVIDHASVLSASFANVEGHLDAQETSVLALDDVCLRGEMGLSHAHLFSQRLSARAQSQIKSEEDSEINVDGMLQIAGKSVFQKTKIQAGSFYNQGDMRVENTELEVQHDIQSTSWLSIQDSNVAGNSLDLAGKYQFDDSCFKFKRIGQGGEGFISGGKVGSNFWDVEEGGSVKVERTPIAAPYVSLSGDVTLKQLTLEAEVVSQKRGSASLEDETLMAVHRSIATQKDSLLTVKASSKIHTTGAQLAGNTTVQMQSEVVSEKTLELTGKTEVNSGSRLFAETVLLNGSEQKVENASVFGKQIFISNHLELTSAAVLRGEQVALQADAQVQAQDSALVSSQSMVVFGELDLVRSQIVAQDLAIYKKLQAENAAIKVKEGFVIQSGANCKLEKTKVETKNTKVHGSLKMQASQLLAEEDISFLTCGDLDANRSMLKAGNEIYLGMGASWRGSALQAQSYSFSNRGSIGVNGLSIDVERFSNIWGVVSGGDFLKIDANQYFMNILGRVTANRTSINTSAGLNLLGDICGADSLQMNSFINLNLGSQRSYNASINSLLNLSVCTLPAALPSSLPSRPMQLFSLPNLLSAAKMGLTHLFPAFSSPINLAWTAGSFVWGHHESIAHAFTHPQEVYSDCIQRLSELKLKDIVPLATAIKNGIGTARSFGSALQGTSSFYKEVRANGFSFQPNEFSWDSIGNIGLNILGPKLAMDSVLNVNAGLMASANVTDNSFFASVNTGVLGAYSYTCNTSHYCNKGISEFVDASLSGRDFENSGDFHAGVLRAEFENDIDCSAEGSLVAEHTSLKARDIKMQDHSHLRLKEGRVFLQGDLKISRDADVGLEKLGLTGERVLAQGGLSLQEAALDLKEEFDVNGLTASKARVNAKSASLNGRALLNEADFELQDKFHQTGEMDAEKLRVHANAVGLNNAKLRKSSIHTTGLQVSSSAITDSSVVKAEKAKLDRSELSDSSLETKQLYANETQVDRSALKAEETNLNQTAVSDSSLETKKLNTDETLLDRSAIKAEETKLERTALSDSLLETKQLNVSETKINSSVVKAEEATFKEHSALSGSSLEAKQLNANKTQINSSAVKAEEATFEEHSAISESEVKTKNLHLSQTKLSDDTLLVREAFSGKYVDGTNVGVKAGILQLQDSTFKARSSSTDQSNEASSALSQEDVKQENETESVEKTDEAALPASHEMLADQVSLIRVDLEGMKVVSSGDAYLENVNAERTALSAAGVMRLEKSLGLENVDIHAGHLQQDARISFRGQLGLDVVGRYQTSQASATLGDKTRDDNTLFVTAGESDMNGEVFSNRAQVKINNFPDAEQFIERKGKYTSFVVTDQLSLETQKNLNLESDIQRDCGLDIKANRIRFASAYSTKQDIGLETTEGDLLIDAKLQANNISAISAKRTRVSADMYSNNDIFFQSSDGFYNLGSNIRAGKQLVCNASVIYQMTQGAEALVSLPENWGQRVGDSGVMQGAVTLLQATQGNIENNGGVMQGTDYAQLITPGDVINRCSVRISQGRYDTLKEFAPALISGGGGLDENRVGLFIQANNVFNDASTVHAQGNIVSNLTGRFESTARSHTFVSKRTEKERFFDTKVTEKTSTTVGQSNVNSEEGSCFVSADSFYSVATNFITKEGTKVLSRNPIELFSLKITNHSYTSKEGAFNLWHSHKHEEHESATPVVFCDQGVTQLVSTEGDIHGRGVVVIGKGDFITRAKQGNVLFESDVLNHHVHEKKSGFGISVGGVAYTPESNYRFTVPWESLDHTFSRANQLLCSHDVLEGSANAWNLGLDGYNTYQSIAENGLGNELLQRYGLGGGGAGFNPSVALSYTKMQSDMRFQSLGPALIQRPSWTVEADTVKLSGIDVDIEETLRIKAREVVLEGKEVTAEVRQRTQAVSVGMTATGEVVDVGVKQSYMHSKSTTQVHETIKAGRFELEAETAKLHNASVETGEADVKVGLLNLETTTDTHQMKVEQFAVSSSGAVSANVQKEKTAVIGQQSGIHVNGDIKKEDIQVDKLVNQGSAITAEGENEFAPRECENKDVKEYRKSSSVGVAGNTMSFFNQGTGTRVIPSVNVSVGEASYKAVQHPSISSGGKDESSHEVLRDRHHHVSIDIPIIPSSSPPAKKQAEEAQEKINEKAENSEAKVDQQEKSETLTEELSSSGAPMKKEKEDDMKAQPQEEFPQSESRKELEKALIEGTFDALNLSKDIVIDVLSKAGNAKVATAILEGLKVLNTYAKHLSSETLDQNSHAARDATIRAAGELLDAAFKPLPYLAALASNLIGSGAESFISSLEKNPDFETLLKQEGVREAYEAAKGWKCLIDNIDFRAPLNWTANLSKPFTDKVESDPSLLIHPEIWEKYRDDESFLINCPELFEREGVADPYGFAKGLQFFSWVLKPKERAEDIIDYMNQTQNIEQKANTMVP